MVNEVGRVSEIRSDFLVVKRHSCASEVALSKARTLPARPFCVSLPGSDEKPQPGDIAAYKIGDGGSPSATKHSGIAVVDQQGPRTMAAHYGGPGPPDNQFATHTTSEVEVTDEDEKVRQLR
jgi:hypothetical protein